MEHRVATDAETGALDPDMGDLLTLYMAVLDEKGKILEELDLLLKPNDGRLPIADAKALEKNGINLQAHLANPLTITYWEATSKIKTMLSKYREGGKYRNIRLFGFNVRFDKGFIIKYLLTKEEYEHYFHYKVVDTGDAIDFLKRCGWLPDMVGTLVSAVKHFDIPMLNAHTAKDDVLMTIELDKKIVELMNAKKNGGQVMDLISLLEAE